MDNKHASRPSGWRKVFAVSPEVRQELTQVNVWGMLSIASSSRRFSPVAAVWYCYIAIGIWTKMRSRTAWMLEVLMAVVAVTVYVILFAAFLISLVS